MVLGGGAFGRYLSHEGGALTNGIGALIKEASESFLIPIILWLHNLKGSAMNQEESCPLALDSPELQNCEK